MKKKASSSSTTCALVVVVSLTLLGCASTRPGDWLKQSTETDIARAPTRPVNVYVVADASSEDISIDEEPIHRKPGVALPIVFRLVTSGYTFPAKDAVTFDDPARRPPAGEIECTTTTDGTLALREVICTNAHKSPGKYAYTLRLVNSRSGKVLDKLDPFIGNH
jgi:hypothetical protein